MNRIIRPGEEQFSSQELQINVRKQALLGMATKWKKFLEATAQSCIDTEVAKEFKKTEIEDDIIRLFWAGGKQIEFEQTHQLKEMKEAGENLAFEEEHIPLAVAEVITQLVGVVQQNPAVIASATWRSFVLCVQLGILKITGSTDNSEIAIEETIDEALSQCTSKCLDNEEDYIAVKTVLATHLRAREEALKMSSGDKENTTND